MKLIRNSEGNSAKLSVREKHTRFVIGIPKDIASMAGLYDEFELTYFTSDNVNELLDFIQNGNSGAAYDIDKLEPHFILLTF